MLARAQDFTIYTGIQFSLVHGSNYGGPLSSKADLYLDDVYRLKTKAQPTRLTLQTAATGRRHRVAPHSPIGAIGAAVHLDCQITPISDAGHTFDALIFVEVELGEIKQVYLSAFAMLKPDTDYRLIGIDRHVDPAKLVELHDPVFYPGTQITLTNGSPCAVEDLTPGQKILTHDFAEQKVSCVEIKTQRTQGKNRPIRISKSHFGTDQDLIISAEHRILCLQTNGSYGGRFLKAKDLCNGTAIDWVAAGFVDCVQIRFATEHVILANGIEVQPHMGGADLESETSEKLTRAVQSASHPAKPGRRAMFLPSGLRHKNVD
jgi:hypothetical protein